MSPLQGRAYDHAQRTGAYTPAYVMPPRWGYLMPSPHIFPEKCLVVLKNNCIFALKFLAFVRLYNKD